VSRKLEQILSRCPAESLKPLLGDETITLLENIGSETLTSDGLAYFVAHSFGEQGALRNQVVRDILITQLKKEEGVALCTNLGLPVHAPSMTLKGVNFDSDPLNIRTLFRWFDVEEDESEHENIREHEASQKAFATHKLRLHQISAYRKLRRLISNPEISVIVHMPYGSGKLRLVATALLDLYRSEPDGRVILWLAPGRALCEEAFAELQKVWEQIGSRDVTIFKCYGKQSDLPLDVLTNCIVVADILTLSKNNADLIKFGRRTRAVVLADAELIGHSSSAEVVSKMSEEGSFNVIGISALSGDVLHNSSSFEAIRARFSGACISSDCTDPIKTLQEGGDTGEIDIEVYPVNQSNIYLSDESFDLNEQQADEISKNVSRNKLLLELLLSESKKTPGRIIFFATTAAHARLFAGLLELSGVKSRAVTSEMSCDQRQQEIKRFNFQGDTKILCVNGFFISGEEIPQVAVAVIAMPTTSEAVFHQIVGRLASNQNSEKSPFKMILVDDSIPRHKRLLESLGTWSKLNI